MKIIDKPMSIPFLYFFLLSHALTYLFYFIFFNYFLDVRVSTFSQRKTMKLSYNIFLWKELVGKENEGG